MRKAWWAVLLLVVFLAGCATIHAETNLRSRLRGAGFGGVGVNFRGGTGDGDGVVVVGYSSGPGATRAADDLAAARVVWTTLPYRFSFLELVQRGGACIGSFCTSSGSTSEVTYTDLEARFGPRDPALDNKTVGSTIRSLGIAVLIGVAVAGLGGLAVVILVIVLVVRSSRKAKAQMSWTGPPPGWGAAPPVWPPPPQPPPPPPPGWPPPPSPP